MAAPAAGPAPCLHCQLQAYGAKAYTVLGQVWQRAVLIMGLLCLPIAALWLSIGRLLLLMGQTPAVAEMTAAYMRSAACTAPPAGAHGAAWLWSCVSLSSGVGAAACLLGFPEAPELWAVCTNATRCLRSALCAHTAMVASLLQPWNGPLPCAAGDWHLVRGSAGHTVLLDGAAVC